MSCSQPIRQGIPFPAVQLQIICESPLEFIFRSGTEKPLIVTFGSNKSVQKRIFILSAVSIDHAVDQEDQIAALIAIQIIEPHKHTDGRCNTAASVCCSRNVACKQMIFCITYCCNREILLAAPGRQTVFINSSDLPCVVPRSQISNVVCQTVQVDHHVVEFQDIMVDPDIIRSTVPRKTRLILMQFDRFPPADDRSRQIPDDHFCRRSAGTAVFIISGQGETVCSGQQITDSQSGGIAPVIASVDC